MAQWVIGEVVKTGAAELGHTVYVKLRPLGGEFPGSRWFASEPGMQKEILATALTAIATQLRVNAYVAALDSPDPQGQYRTLSRLYVSHED